MTENIDCMGLFMSSIFSLANSFFSVFRNN